MIELAETYPRENEILDIYLKNASVATVVIEINSDRVGALIREHLQDTYGLKPVDYAGIQEGIIQFLRETGQREGREERRICIYHFPTDSQTIDVVKSLNISRELLRKLDQVVFLMPTLLVKQIQEREPNLKDYIGLFLNYNRKVRVPFEPVYDVPFQKRFTKGEKQALKGEYLGLERGDSLKEGLNQYFCYINQFHNRKLSKYVCNHTLIPAYEEILVEVHDYPWERNSDYRQAVRDIMYQTASVLAVQKYYDRAKEIFEMIPDLAEHDGNQVEISVLQALEGAAYCEYGTKEYRKAQSTILTTVDILRDTGTQNEAWICRLYSNYAACLMRQKEYEQAKRCLLTCLDSLEENRILTAEREMRVCTNLMICCMELGENSKIYENLWKHFIEDMEAAYGRDSISFANCLLLDSWYKGILMGMNEEALAEAENALEINKKLLTVNDYTLAVNYDVLEKLYQQAGQWESEYMASVKKKNILRNYQ